jgi:hypothetical protein
MADPDGNEFDVLQPLTPNELPPGTTLWAVAPQQVLAPDP